MTKKQARDPASVSVKAGKHDFDQACAFIMHLDALPLLLWLLGLGNKDLRFVSWLRTKNIAWPGQPDRICDTVADFRDRRANGLPWLIVVEFQIEADPLMFGRLLIYLGHAWIELKPEDLPGDRYNVGAVVVNLTGKGKCSQQMTLTGTHVLTHLGVAEWNFQELSAAELVDLVASGQAPRLALVWLPLFQGGGDVRVIERGLALADEEKNPRKRQAFELLLLFAEKAGCLEAWRQAMKGWNVTRSKVADEWRAEAEAKGRTEGLTEGLIEGARAGKLDALVQVLERLTKTKVPAKVRRSLSAIKDNARVEELFALALQSPTIEEFTKKAKL